MDAGAVRHQPAERPDPQAVSRRAVGAGVGQEPADDPQRQADHERPGRGRRATQEGDAAPSGRRCRRSASTVRGGESREVMSPSSSPGGAAPPRSHAGVADVQAPPVLTYRGRAMRDTADFDAFYADARATAPPPDLRPDRGPAGVPRPPCATRSSSPGTTGARCPSWRTPSAGCGRWPGRTRSAGTAPGSGTAPGPTDPELGATLDALGRLSLSQRKVLLLTQLTRGSLEEIAREAELPLTVAERELQSATALFATHRNIDSALIRTALDPLAGPVAERPLAAGHHHPHAPGSARRRSHTLVGAAVVVGLLVASGAAVTHEDGVRPRLTKEKVVASPSPVSTTPTDAPVTLSEQPAARRRPARAGGPRPALDGGVDVGGPRGRRNVPALPVLAVRRPGRHRQPGAHLPDDSGPGRTTPAERRRRSRPSSPPSCPPPRAPPGAPTRRPPDGTPAAPRSACSCSTPTRSTGSATTPTLLVLRSWRAPVTTVVVGVARSGQVTTTTMTRVTGSDRSRPGADTVRCSPPRSTHCAGLRVPAPVPVPPSPWRSPRCRRARHPA